MFRKPIFIHIENTKLPDIVFESYLEVSIEFEMYKKWIWTVQKMNLNCKNNVKNMPMKINVPTFRKNNLPETLKSTPITVPGSRFIKWKD